MTSSMLRRQLKNLVQNYSEAEVKVREATSNDPWGPSSSQMADISDLTYNVVACNEIMTMLWKRLKDDKNWRHIHKSLTLLEYLLKTGDDRVLLKMKDNIYIVKALTEYRFVEKDGKDQGVNVREKAKVVLVLMEDDEKLKQERDFAVKTREKTSKSSAASSTDAIKDPNYTPRYVPGATGLPSLDNIPSVADLTASFAARKEERLRQEAEKKEAERRAKMSEDELQWEDAGKGVCVPTKAWGEEKAEEEVKPDPWGAPKEPKEATDPWGTPTRPDTTDTVASSDPWGGQSKSDEDHFASPTSDEGQFEAPKNGDDHFIGSKDDPFNATKDSSDPFKAPKENDDPFSAPKGDEDPFSSSNSGPFNTPKDDPFNTPKDDPFNTPKDDPFNTPKDDPFNTPKDDPFNTTKNDPFNTPKDDPFNSPKDDPFSSPKNDPFNTPKDDPFSSPKDDPFNTPKDDPFNTPKDDPFNTPKDDPFNTPKDDPFNTPKDDPPQEDPFAAPTSSKDDPFTAPKSPAKEDPVSALTKHAQEDPFAAPTTPLKDDPFSDPSELPETDPFTSPTSPKEDPFSAPPKTTQKDSFTAPTTPPKDSVDPFGAPLAKSPQGSPEAWEAPASSPPAAGTDAWEKLSSPMETKGGDPWGKGATAPSPADSSDPFGDSSNAGADPWGSLASAPASTDAWGSAAPPSDCSPSSDPFGDGASKASDPWGAPSNAASNATGKQTEREEETYRKTAQFLGSVGASLVDLDDLFSSHSKQRPPINVLAAQTRGNDFPGTFKSRDRMPGPVVSSEAAAGMSLHETSALPGTPFSFTHSLSHGASSPTFRAPVPSGETPLIHFPFHTMGVSYSGFSLPQALRVAPETRVRQPVSGGPHSGHNMTHPCGGMGMVQTRCPVSNPMAQSPSLGIGMTRSSFLGGNLQVGAGQLGGSTSQVAGGVPVQSHKL